MPPVFGTVTCFPSNNFAFNRGYLRGIAITSGGWPTTLVDNLITVTVGMPVIYRNYVLLEDYIVPFSSNAYTLNYVVKEAYFILDGSTTKNPASDNLTWRVVSDPPTPTLYIDLLATGLPLSILPVQAPPSNYWAR